MPVETKIAAKKDNKLDAAQNGSEHFRISIHLWAKLIFWWKNLCRPIQSNPFHWVTKKSSFLKTFRMRRLSACGNINNDQKIYARTCEFFLAAKKYTSKNTFFLSVTDYAEEVSENRIENWEKRACKNNKFSPIERMRNYAYDYQKQ